MLITVLYSCTLVYCILACVGVTILAVGSNVNCSVHPFAGERHERNSGIIPVHYVPFVIQVVVLHCLSQSLAEVLSMIDINHGGISCIPEGFNIQSSFF